MSVKGARTFEKQLVAHAVDGWRPHYLSFNALAEQVELVQAHSVLGTQDRVRKESEQFMRMLDHELQKVNIFYRTAESFFAGRIRLLECRLKDSMRDSSEIIYDLLVCAKGLLNLEDYVFLNHAGFDYALKLYDRALHQKRRKDVLKRVESSSFYTRSPPEELCAQIERLYVDATSRSRQRAGVSRNGPYQLSQSFVTDSGGGGRPIRSDLWRECRRLTAISHDIPDLVPPNRPSSLSKYAEDTYEGRPSGATAADQVSNTTKNEESQFEAPSSKYRLTSIGYSTIFTSALLLVVMYAILVSNM